MTARGRPVVHLIAPSPAGGAESVVLALASAAADRTQVIILDQVAHAGSPPHPLAEQLRRRGVLVDEVRCGRRRYRAEAREVSRRLLEAKAALVHTHGYHGTLVGWWAARQAGLPVVATVHGYLRRNVKERLYNALDRRLLRRFDATITVSQGIRDELLASGVKAHRIHLVQNGFAPSAHTRDRAEARQLLGLDGAADQVVGWIGRLSPEKGADLFLEGMVASGMDARGVIVGDGPERPLLDEMARTLGAGGRGNRFHFVGQQPDAAGLLSAFDVLAVTSRIEGTPMVVLEAVAAGVPIVAFRIGGIPDLLDGDTAWLVPPENVKELGVALAEALSSPAEARRRAVLARERLADRLSLDRWLERIWAVYDEVLSRDARGAGAG